MKKKQIKYISLANQLELSIVILSQAHYSKLLLKYKQKPLLELLNKYSISVGDESTVSVSCWSPYQENSFYLQTASSCHSVNSDPRKSEV